MQYILKTLLSAVVIVSASEFAKRSGVIGGLIASLPIVSILAIIWLYVDTKSADKVATFSISIFWMVIPSLVFFLLLPYLIKKQISVPWAITMSCIATSFVYYAVYLIYNKLGIKV